MKVKRQRQVEREGGETEAERRSEGEKGREKEREI